MVVKNKLRVLGLSPKEERVLLALRDGTDTPLALARKTGVSRPAVYAILQNLKKRALVDYRTAHDKKSWQLSKEIDIDREIADAKNILLNIPEGSERIAGISDSTVIIHRGKEAIKKLIHHLLVEHKNERLEGSQGNVSTVGWDKVFTTAETNRFNRSIKDNGIIVEAVLPEGWFEEQTRIFGVDWAKDFEGRTTRVNTIDPKYFKHGGQIWIFKDSLYLLALNEELIIEIRHSEIQKMIRAFLELAQDMSRSVDANGLLRALIARGEVQGRIE